MQLIDINKDTYNGYSTSNRCNYTVLAFSWKDFTQQEKDMIFKEANILANNSNATQANTGNIRSLEKHYIDSLSGIIAEYAVLKFFYLLNLHYYSSYSAHRPIVTSSKDQVDISLSSPQKNLSVEVRSSFVKNGLGFALFAINPRTKKSYFDIIGTYKQESYKEKFECQKDLFMRVLFDIKSENSNTFFLNRESFMEKFIHNEADFYIIGGMTGTEIQQIGHLKNLNSNDITDPKMISGEYNVSEIFNVHDMNDFVKNNFLNTL